MERIQPPGSIGRRSLLLGGGVAAGAVVVGVLASPEPEGVFVLTEPTADEVALRGVLASERQLLQTYDAALARDDLDAQARALLQACRSDHEAHIAALGGGAARPNPGPGSSAALDGLRDLEQAAAGQRQRIAKNLTDAQLRRTMVLIGASERSHAEALGELT